MDLTAPGPVLMAKGAFAKVPIIAGSVREDITSPWAAINNPHEGTPPAPCAPTKCTQLDFVRLV